MIRRARPLLAIPLALLVLLQAAAPVAASAGELDDEFDGNGKLTVNFSPGADFLAEVAIQPGDQKILAVGRSVAGGDGEWIIIRVNPDGTFDNTFGGGDGIATIDFSSGEDYANALALQADGKIVVAGLAGRSGGRWGVVRLGTDGAPDSSFSGDGRQALDLTGGFDVATDVVIQDDGKIAVTGWSDAADARFTVARYTTGGALDTTFSGDGIATANLTPGLDLSNSMGIDNNGKIVVTGYASGSGGQIGLVRFRTNGTLDPNFSGDGKLMRNTTGGFDIGTGVGIQPADNKVVLSASSGGSNGKMEALRYNADGTPDPTFAGDGRKTIDVTAFADNANSVAIQDDGKVVLAGTANFEFFTIVRLSSSGELDTAFGDDGVMFANITPDYDVAYHVGIQADGDIVAVGESSGQGGRISIARFLGA